MLQLNRPGFICWRCLRRKGLATQTLGQSKQRTGALTGSSPAAQRRRLATVQHETSSQITLDPLAQKVGIRERLRIWEAEDRIGDFPDPLPPDDPELRKTMRNAHLDSKQTTIEVDLKNEDEQPHFDGHDLVDTVWPSSKLHAGDLVEVTSDSWRTQLLAICLGNFNGFDHFYTNTGKWFTGHGVRTAFIVRSYVEPSELDQVIEALPTTAGSPELLNTLEELRMGPSRDAGASLIKKMHEFQAAADLIHQANALKLDNAFRHVGGQEKVMSLEAIANALLPTSYKLGQQFTPASLYAVHTALSREDICFRSLGDTDGRGSYLFEVSSIEDVHAITNTEKIVSEFYQRAANYKIPLKNYAVEKAMLGDFILKARKAIDNSRRRRDWTPYGVLGPSRKDFVPERQVWTPREKEILYFLQLWAGAEKFSSASRYHWAGAGILRATQRYLDSLMLDQALAWTFLQEVGWIKPWEIQSVYSARLPGVPVRRGGGLQPLQDSALTTSLSLDGAVARKDWKGLRVYCIDAESAADIDDGISLEHTDIPGEYWIHVHVADPAAYIRPDTVLAERAALVPLTLYLPGNVSKMTGVDVGHVFSLKTDGTCLTFSGKVDAAGTLLEYKVTPGTIRDVVYATRETVAAALGEAPATEALQYQEPFSVGERAATKAKRPSRQIAKIDDFSEQDINDLKKLSQLARAIQTKRRENGAMPRYFPRPSAEVSFQGVTVEKDNDMFLQCSGDPHIRIGYNELMGLPIVDSIMVLAGEIAARWCHERGIPIPYRGQAHAVNNKTQLDRFTREVYYPPLEAGERPTDENWRTFRALLGPVETSTEPHPYFTMGLDMYTKATSPMRRYGDLLVHWQIHAALWEEKRHGKSLVGNRNDLFLPFTRGRLDNDILPVMTARERTVQMVDRSDGNMEWILQALVRAWKFGEGKPHLPEQFRFRVTTVLGRRLVKGRLDWFELPALIEPAGLEGVRDGPVRMGDIKVGDMFDVALEHINVPGKEVFVKVLQRVEA